MKEGMILKTAETGSVSPEEMGKINRYSRRELDPGEVYTFSVVLCDNEIDRDGERLTINALKRLSGLFLGKTGIFDHNPKGENQTARIYDACVLTDSSRKTGVGELYTYLKASAYMVRSSKTEELILEIDAGIKKEVSVGCSVQKMTCSICGADLKHGRCPHKKGEIIGGKVCHTVLDQPSDAYEWSFVAVPSQRAAGVVKNCGETPRNEEMLLKSLYAAERDLVLSPAEQQELTGLLEQEHRKAAQGERYVEELRDEVLRLSCLVDSNATFGVTKSLLPHMDVDGLTELREAYRKKWNDSDPACPQLQKNAGKQDSEAGKREFMI